MTMVSVQEKSVYKMLGLCLKRIVSNYTVPLIPQICRNLFGGSWLAKLE